MTNDRVVIEELFLRLPGVSAEAARAISAEVAGRIGAGLAAAMPKRSLGALDLQLRLPPNATRSEIVETVARSILEALLR
jgi:hypothetical protein